MFQYVTYLALSLADAWLINGSFEINTACDFLLITSSPTPPTGTSNVKAYPVILTFQPKTDTHHLIACCFFAKFSLLYIKNDIVEDMG
jgi:hypothetical protein